MKYFIESSWDGLAKAMSADLDLQMQKKAMIVTDNNVAPLFLNEVRKALCGVPWQISNHIIPAGEGSKNFRALTEVLQAMHEAGLDRGSVVFALGGGVVSDIAGFAASCYMRGINYINLPTTLLSQADSAIGGKTGIDFMGQKNLIGTFHAPHLVYTNIAALNTLPQQDYISGLAEVIKYGIIYDRGLLEFLYDNTQAVLERDEATVLHIVRRSCAIKTEVVMQDEKDKGLRQILNFGHTVGHAVESLSEFTLPHGYCVAIGMAQELQYLV
ncbi:MAG: 3-dehydroquinate synthase, partial [Defluviitaleaceae bacterium]|nr:3-dehydroquinate synthase [Defluviitaleaceae bacterium]